MPESKGRDKPAYTPPPRAAQKVDAPNARWFAPVMVGLMVLGLLWVVTYYLSGIHQFPIPALGVVNLFIGFGLMLAGFIMTTRWR
ncbi:MAG: cell division protein CrgA [Tetrasphaera sp.]|nr:cell division protein CrgA [Tetrasphaera sp.]